MFVLLELIFITVSTTTVIKYYVRSTLWRKCADVSKG